MSVFHVLKDGSTPKEITGHIVKVSDADPLYRYIHSINGGSSPDRVRHTYLSKTDNRRVIS